jgi:hypothetical protein
VNNLALGQSPAATGIANNSRPNKQIASSYDPTENRTN